MAALLHCSTSSRCSNAVTQGPLQDRRLRCFVPARTPQLTQRVHCVHALNQPSIEESNVLSRRDSLLITAFTAFACVGPASAQVQTPPKAEGITTVVPLSALSELTPSERQVYKLNRRVQTQNRLLDDFPIFIREGFNVKILGDNFNTTPEGLIYSVLQEGKGVPAKAGQQVVFDYVGYNESGTTIDSSYRQGKPAEATLGIGGVIPGFEIALTSMPPGSKWRIIIPPELGPPVGPSTFFSAKQCEVFDISVLDIKNCSRKPMLMFSQLVCE